MSIKNVEYYMNLHYHLEINKIDDESGSYFLGTVKEFPGCQSTRDSFKECCIGLEEAMKGWIKTKLDNGFIVPEPFDD